MPITPFRLAGALIIAGALGTASVVARGQQSSRPAPEQPAPKDPPPQTQGQPAPPDGQPSGQSGQPAQGQTGQPAQGQAPPDQPQRPTFRTDINFVRVNSGGLAATSLTTASTDDQFITELLYNRRYSLFFEFGQRISDIIKVTILISFLH